MRTARTKHAGAIGNAVAILAAIGLATGCGVTVDGEPEAEVRPTAGGEQHVEWNPCTELSDKALQATGADASSKNTVFDAPGDEAVWRMCTWKSIDGPYSIGVGATTLAQDDVYQNTSVTDISPVQVNNRSGLTYRLTGNDDPILLCYVSLPMSAGMLNVYVSWRYGERNSIPESPPCGLAIEHAQTLEPYLPE